MGAEEPGADGDPGRNEADLAAFWEDYRPHLRRYAGKLLQQSGIPSGRLDVNDVTQTVYADLKEKWSEVRNPIGFTRSRAKIAVFGALRDERRRGASLDADFRHDDESKPQRLDVPDPAPTAEERRIERETAHQLAEDIRQAFDELSPSQREAVRLRHLEGLTPQETANRMDMPVGTVSSHRGRGIAKLRDHLRDVELPARTWANAAMVRGVVVAVMVIVASVIGVGLGLLAYGQGHTVAFAVLFGFAQTLTLLAPPLISFYHDRRRDLR